MSHYSILVCCKSPKVTMLISALVYLHKLIQCNHIKYSKGRPADISHGTSCLTPYLRDVLLDDLDNSLHAILPVQDHLNILRYQV